MRKFSVIGWQHGCHDCWLGAAACPASEGLDRTDFTHWTRALAAVIRIGEERFTDLECQIVHQKGPACGDGSVPM
jgi:hypothetical protein